MSEHTNYQRGEVNTKFRTGSIRLESQPEIEKFLNDNRLSEATGLIYLDYGICWAKMVSGRLITRKMEELEPKYIQRARFFNQERELHCWLKKEQEFAFRLRIDGEGEALNIIDADQYLLGVAEKTEEGFTLLQESQGKAGWVPVELGRGQRAVLKTRNYIDFAGDLVAGFCDHRLIEISKGGTEQ